ncbi:NIF family HAD-type phosphatase [Allohahella marinimesophila]|uniref:NIF family HAD-type phosphatase n=1 Tax=Allohahella marinimesophila TaxID=1054972 RepID=UPI0031D48812
MDNLICLDLEGTLISNAVSQIPRPGLHKFLDQLSMIGEIVLFTSVSPQRTQVIKELLVKEGCAPGWFLNVPSVHPKATTKFKRNVPNFLNYQRVLLVDDQAAVIAETETDWWVAASEYLPPYPPDDRELEAVLHRIRERVRRS